MTETSEEILTSALPEKCTRQPVQTVKLRQKFLSNLTQKDRFTAESVFLTTGHPEKTADIKPEFRFGRILQPGVRFASLKRTYTSTFFKYIIAPAYTFS
jgi:hypothetical protein